MSQKVRVTHVKVKGGQPYLGQHDGMPRYSDDPDAVMRWLCDGWRSRYNQCRSTRRKYGPDHELIPIGDTVTDLTDAQARRACPWLAALPTLILQSPSKLEAVEWYSNVKRRKTARKQHRNPGRMPRFKSRHHDPLTFVCWYDGGRNAVFRQVNKTHGIVTITGQNPVGFRAHGARWRVEIHVKTSQPVRAYTNVRVNWTDRTLVFTNPPQPLDATLTGRAVGLDRGVAHQLATSDGRFIDLPQAKLNRISKEVARRQKAMARKALLAGYHNQRDYRKHGASKRYERERRQVARLYRKARDITVDWAQQATTRLVRGYDFIVMEGLNLQGMIRRCKPKPDPKHPGRYLHNGQTAKCGLNRGLLQSNLGLIRSLLEYKTRLLSGKTLATVNPAYTSRTCIRCGHCAKENRESQAVFSCTKCGFTWNADLNAAVNILDMGVRAASAGELSEQGMDYALRAVNMARHGDATRGSRALFAREPQPSDASPATGIPRL